MKTSQPPLVQCLVKVKKLSGELTPVFALEDVGGYGRSLAVYLTEKKETVKAVNPALANDRRKSTPTYKKDDYFDALTVAKVLKEDFDELPTANPTDIYLLGVSPIGRAAGFTCKEYCYHTKPIT